MGTPLEEGVGFPFGKVNGTTPHTFGFEFLGRVCSNVQLIQSKAGFHFV